MFLRNLTRIATSSIITSKKQQLPLPLPLLQSLQRTTTTTTTSSFHTTTSLAMGRKAGVSSPEELKKFVEEAGERLLVVDGE